MTTYAKTKLNCFIGDQFEPNNIVSSTHALLFGPWAAQREFALNLPLPQVFNLGIYEIPETV
jgi:hypothetical protein